MRPKQVLRPMNNCVGVYSLNISFLPHRFSTSQFPHTTAADDDEHIASDRISTSSSPSSMILVHVPLTASSRALFSVESKPLFALSSFMYCLLLLLLLLHCIEESEMIASPRRPTSSLPTVQVPLSFASDSLSLAVSLSRTQVHVRGGGSPAVRSRHQLLVYVCPSCGRVVPESALYSAE